jgi:hypothetical protein
MRYHYSLIAIAGASLIAMSAATFVSAQAPSGPGVFGFFDAASGSFRPVTLQQMPSSTTSVEPRAQVSRAGKIRFRLNITVLSGSPATELPFCQGSFSHQGVLHSYSESQNVQGTRVGNNADCIIPVSYSWPAANNANSVSLSFFVSLPGRSHSESLPSIPLPANGAITVISVNLTS